MGQRKGSYVFVWQFNKRFRDEVWDANLFNTTSQAQEAADAWGRTMTSLDPTPFLVK